MMIAHSFPKRSGSVPRTVLAGLAAWLALAGPALAVSSPWSASMGGKFRLVAAGGKTTADGRYLAGIQIALAPGWKTYWRSPGDSGIPPRFDFAASSNVGSVEVLYPPPVRDYDGFSTTLVYKSDVVFPLRIAPKDPTKPVLLTVKAEYGICEKVCVPAESEATVFVSPKSHADAETTGLIDTALRRVPAALTAADTKAGRGVKSVTFDAETKRLEIEVGFASTSGKRDLFAEGPESWYLGVPKPEAGKDAKAGGGRYGLSLASVPKSARLKGTKLTFTIVDGKTAYQQVWRLE